MMSKILYVLDNNKNSKYNYDIDEDTIIYHYSINSSSVINVNLVKEDIRLDYYYNTINYDDNKYSININHKCNNTHSEVYNHGINMNKNILTFDVCGIVPKKYSKCICNQDNQIINMDNGKSTILPKLLIDNYDVDSNHSAYIGKFKDEYLFYLMSRGISRENSYRLLLEGFLINSDSIEKDKIKDFIDEINRI